MLEYSGILPQELSGFCFYRSTADDITDLLSSLEVTRTTRHPPYVVFLDIHSAFDTLLHILILPHFQHSGVSGKMTALLKTFLSGRIFRVNIRDIVSNPEMCTRESCKAACSVCCSSTLVWLPCRGAFRPCSSERQLIWLSMSMTWYNGQYRGNTEVFQCDRPFTMA